MTDRELLEKAAKAAGMKPGSWFDGWNDEGRGTGDYWNPLAEDGDALRLAVKLRVRVDITDDVARAEYGLHDAGCCGKCSEPLGADHCAAARRAIVRAAAEMPVPGA